MVEQCKRCEQMSELLVKMVNPPIILQTVTQCDRCTVENVATLRQVIRRLDDELMDVQDQCDRLEDENVLLKRFVTELHNELLQMERRGYML